MAVQVIIDLMQGVWIVEDHMKGTLPIIMHSKKTPKDGMSQMFPKHYINLKSIYWSAKK